jgi:hypothetical protein
VNAGEVPPRAAHLRERCPTLPAVSDLPRVRDADCIPKGGLMSLSALLDDLNPHGSKATRR